jgi:hypothetical protein
MVSGVRNKGETMSLICKCGCGKTIPEKETKLNKFGELETMRQDCIAIGRGEEIGSDLLEKVYTAWVMGLNKEQLDKLEGR